MAHITPLFEEDYAGGDDTPDTIIFEDDPLLASVKETISVFNSLLNEPANLRETNLKLTNKDWGGAENDTLLTHLISIPAQYAVKHGLPLTTTQAKEAMSKDLSINNTTTYINTMENVWGGCFPLNFTTGELPPYTRFASMMDEKPSSSTPPPPSTVVALARDQVILAPLSLLDCLAHIVNHTGPALTFNNIKQFIIDDIKSNTSTTPGSW